MGNKEGKLTDGVIRDKRNVLYRTYLSTMLSPQIDRPMVILGTDIIKVIILMH